MNQSLTPFQIGQIAGVIMVLLLLGGLCVFFVISLVKAVTTRRTGWIISACASGAPFLGFIILMTIGFVVGFKRGFSHSTELAAARRGEPSELLTAEMTPLTGNSLPYQISLPGSEFWAKADAHAPFDYLFSYHDAYVGVIAEGIGMNTPQNICDVSQKNLSSKASACSFTIAHPLDIDSHSWLTFDATVTLRNVNIKYRFYDYADTNYTFQIVTWTGPALFNRDAPVFDRIAKSFKIPQ